MERKGKESERKMERRQETEKKGQGKGTAMLTFCGFLKVFRQNTPLWLCTVVFWQQITQRCEHSPNRSQAEITLAILHKLLTHTSAGKNWPGDTIFTFGQMQGTHDQTGIWGTALHERDVKVQ